MSLHPILPVAVLALVVVPLLVVTAAFAVRGLRAGSSAGRAQASAWTVRFLLVLVVGAMGLGPSVPRTSTDSAAAAVDVFFVVDRTGSMAAEDYDGTSKRLDGAKSDILSVVADIPGARYSIISFDSQATRQLPLTTDTRAVRSWTETADREITYRSRGSLVDRPLAELTKALEGSVEQRPANVRLVFFLSDGENTAKGPRASFEGLAPLVDGGAVFGYGTEEGGRMHSLDFSASGAIEEGDYIVDYSGGSATDAISRIDTAELEAIASELGVEYLHRTAPGPTAEVTDGIDPDVIATDGRRAVTSFQPLLWPFALALTVLLGLEAWGTGRRIGRNVGLTHG